MSTNADLRTALAEINTDYNVMVQSLFGENLPGNYTKYTDVTTTTALIKKFIFLGDLPLMRRWVGARQEKGVRAFYSSMELETWEATIPIQRKEIQYDGSKAVTQKIGQFLSAQAQVYNLNSAAKLISNPVGYDGVAIFSASHPYAKDAGVSSNYSTNPLTRGNYETCRALMRSLTTEYGRNVYSEPDTIMCGPALEPKAKEIFEAKTRKVVVDHTGAEATQLAVGATNMDNVWSGELDVIIDPNFVGAAAYYWILLNTKIPGVKPVVILEGEKPHSVNMDSMDDPRRFTFDEYVYGVEGDFAFCPGFWQVAFGNLSTTL